MKELEENGVLKDDDITNFCDIPLDDKIYMINEQTFEDTLNHNLTKNSQNSIDNIDIHDIVGYDTPKKRKRN